ncbi:nucleocapsid [Nyavirus nyamaniniense]|uniref:Nucleocapsid n=1 Tax=Nyavirus nyamaniniense TaxID=644610 RepID=C4NFM0_9MONO|nr:nucleocapsid [Nyavirus nyamaniniense]ACQ94980.1 nucleocapsid [Nyavirus nyamaniniense]
MEEAGTSRSTGLRRELEELYKFHKQERLEVIGAEVRRAPLFARPLSALAANDNALLSTVEERELEGIGSSCIVQCFPELLKLPGWEEAMSKLERNAVVEIEGTPVEKRPKMVQIGAYITLCTLCFIVKPLTNLNSEYIKKRWSALLGSRNIQNLLSEDPGLENKLMSLALVDAKRIAGLKLKAEIIRAVRDYDDSTLGPTLQALIAQVRMVYKGHGMTMLSEMDLLVKVQPMRRVLLQSAVAEEALKFEESYQKAKERHGKDFEYLGALGISDETLHHRQYPNLYFAARAVAQTEKRVGTGMQFSELPTNVNQEILRTDSLKTVKTKREITRDLVEKLRLLGHDITGLLKKESKKRKRDESSEEEEEDWD